MDVTYQMSENKQPQDLYAYQFKVVSNSLQCVCREFVCG